MQAPSLGFVWYASSVPTKCEWIMPDGQACGRVFLPANKDQVVCEFHTSARTHARQRERNMLKKDVPDSANKITADIMVKLSEEFHGQCVTWRRNVGAGYPPTVIKVAISMLKRGGVAECIRFLETARPVYFGKAGEPDLDGLLTIDSMGVRLGIEVKTTDELRPAQKICRELYRERGAIYIVGHSVKEAIDGVRRALHLVGGHS